MEHYQIQKACGVCKRMLIADVFSIGTGHQTIEGLTCLECAQGIPNGNVMAEGEIRELKITNKPSLEF